MTSELLSQIWQMSQASSQGPIRKLTPDTYHRRLTPETASAGFIALHTAESMHRFAQMIFGHDMDLQTQTAGGVSDEGQPLDLAAVQQLIDESFAMIADFIQQTTDNQWDERIPTPFGEVSRMQVLVFLMHHNSYHAGQIAQATKKGKEVTVANHE